MPQWISGVKIRFAISASRRRRSPWLPGVASILLVTVPVLLLCGSWPASETDRQSLFAWLFNQYGEDFLPALFAIRGAWLLVSQWKAWARLPSTPELRGIGGFLAMLALYAVARWLKLPALGYVSVVGMGWFLVLASKGAVVWRSLAAPGIWFVLATPGLFKPLTDRKSTRLNSSHG